MTLDSLFWRELVNGAWFVMGLFVWLMFVKVIMIKVRQYGWRTILLKTWNHKDIGLKAAVALLMYFTGSVMRAGYIWMLLLTENEEYLHGWFHKLESSYFIMFIASAFAMLGASCTYRTFTSEHGISFRWSIVVILSLTVPALVHVWLR